MKKLSSSVISVIIVLAMVLSLWPAVYAAEDALPTLTVDLTNTGHDIIHGAAGFLYGISNDGVPEVNTLTPLKPKVLATKGALGTEHPYADALDVAEEFFEAGGQQVQMYNSNYYGVFGVTADAYEYGDVLTSIICPAVVEWKNKMRKRFPDIDKMLQYIPINESTPANVGGKKDLHAAWKIYYQAIKAGDPNATIVGPNKQDHLSYNEMYSFLSFCRENNCLPDIITWHELQTSDLNNLNINNPNNTIESYRRAARDAGVEEAQVVINEYADYADCGVPGRLVNWIARLEDNRVYGCLPFWHQANNLNDLAAGANEGNGAWWVYKWYGDMSGQTLYVKQQNTAVEGFYGVAAIDSNKRIMNVICGGTDGKARVRLENVNEAECFKDDEKIHVKVEASYFSGYHGPSYAAQMVNEGTFAIESDGSVTVELDDMLFSTAYNITLTEAAENDEITAPSVGRFRAEYEAENAKRFGEASYEPQNAYPPYYYSGNARVNNFNSVSDGIEYYIKVPTDGRYKLEFIYGNGVGESRNNELLHNPQNLSHLVSIDGGEQELLPLPNTLFYAMEGKADKYCDLTAGRHRVRVTGDGRMSGGTQDVLYISYAGAYGEDILFNQRFEAEATDFNTLGNTVQTTLRTRSDVSGYFGSGYIEGLDENSVENGGGARTIVNVEGSGLYHLSFRYMSETEGKLNVYLDNTNLSFGNRISSVSLSKTNGWEQSHTSVFLRKGINIVDVDADVPVKLDCMSVIRAEGEFSQSFEAENSRGSFTPISSSYASGGSYVPELLAGEENYIEFDVDAAADGTYKMQVFQSNNDLCGSHSYNIKIIDRYASFTVNGEDQGMYFFPNSFSDDTFLERTIPLELKKGKNTIRIYNDDSWKVKYGGTTSTPGENVLVNYTPNFDRFVITPAAVDDLPMSNNGGKIDVSYSVGGYAFSDKNFADKGETAVITMLAEGSISKVTVNGADFTHKVTTSDYKSYTLELEGGEDAEVYVSFRAPQNGGQEKPDIAVNDKYITINGETYIKTGENLFKNGDFSDSSGKNMNQWYVGTNTNGHPSASDYKIPIPAHNANAAQNLVKLTDSGLLTTGGYEKDSPNTFYYGSGQGRKYLVEHMHSDWRNCAWNGSASLLCYIPIEENKTYYFKFSAYSDDGNKASIRYGAIDVDEGDGFYVKTPYSANQSLNFCGEGGLSCNNGDMQNIGGRSWNDHGSIIKSGEGADFFLFNAYWLQMAGYLCLGDFELYEVYKAEIAVSAEELAPVRITAGERPALPSKINATLENGAVKTFDIDWAAAENTDFSSPGVYSLPGTVKVPEGFCFIDSDMQIVYLRVIAEDANRIYFSDNGNIMFNSVSDARAIVASYNKDGTLLKAEIADTKAGETLSLPFPQSGAVKAMLWDKNMQPLCSAAGK